MTYPLDFIHRCMIQRGVKPYRCIIQRGDESYYRMMQCGVNFGRGKSSLKTLEDSLGP